MILCQVAYCLGNPVRTDTSYGGCEDSDCDDRDGKYCVVV